MSNLKEFLGQDESSHMLQCGHMTFEKEGWGAPVERDTVAELIHSFSLELQKTRTLEDLGMCLADFSGEYDGRKDIPGMRTVANAYTVMTQNISEDPFGKREYAQLFIEELQSPLLDRTEEVAPLIGYICDRLRRVLQDEEESIMA